MVSFLRASGSGSRFYQWLPTHTNALFAVGWTLLGTLCGARADAPAFDPTSFYRVRKIEGWTVRVHRKLLDDRPEVAKSTLRLLEAQLFQIVRVVPNGPLAELQKIPIWIENHHPRHPCACYHMDEGWLRENGFNPEKLDSVEIANPDNFLTWTKDQPWMILHELAHGYHDRVLGWDDNRLKARYEAMKSSGTYESVLRYKGKFERHYALNNPGEYFAESTEAWFGTNDYYPFVRAELEKHDPEMAVLMKAIWGEPKR